MTGANDFNFVDKIFVVKKAAFLTDNNLELIWERKPATDWTKVAVDTKVLIEFSGKWNKRHFAKYENGKIFAYTYGTTSFTGSNNSGITYWGKNAVVLYEGNEHLVGDKHE